MAAKKRKAKKVSLNEFRAWLEGIEEMQEDGWTPSAEQWNTIRDRVNHIVPDVTEKIVEKTVAAPTARVTPAPQIPARTSAPSILQDLTPNAPKPQMVDGRIKTPDIDTTDGEYKSGFV